MKFARYLEETQIPEWKRAYIDFKGLKKRIAAITKARQGAKSIHLPDSHREAFEYSVAEPARRQSYGSLDHTPHSHHPQSSPALDRLEETEETTRDGQNRAAPQRRRAWSEALLSHSDPRNDHDQLDTDRVPSLSRLFATVTGATKTPTRSDATLESLYASLEPLELSFFTYLDHELEKVDTFYNEREGEAMIKLSTLKDQIRELSDHRRLFHEAQASRIESWTVLPRALGEALGVSGGHNLEPTDLDAVKRRAVQVAPSHLHPPSPFRDPGEYHHAKRKLKKAFQEYYRSLELLNDYRILNLTGFRKALKKFEKVTRYPVQDLYLREKIHPRRFAFSGTMDDTMRDIENIYATRFESGDRKKARRRLKSPFLHKSHHFSTFRSGTYIGVAIPALISAVYSSFRFDTRHKIPEWGPLLEIYATLMIPVVFSLLLGLNLLAWAQARINFAFIFELDVRTAIDIREYFELPAFLFATLCWAMWLSFFAIGSQNVAPTTWPIIWIGLAVAIMINPLPLFSRSSRFWLIKNTSRLLVAGTSRVEFTDFWLGDQFCSLVFSLAHLFTIGCAYSHHWSNVFGHCGSATHWPAPYALLALPYLARLVQSIRRYHDSKLPTHLINGGKYLSSVVMYATYYAWRSRGSQRDISFAMWLLFATLSSIYTCSWDLLMDWSFLRRHSPHRFLRAELIYTNNPLIYYFAIVSNVAIRFIWTIYIPSAGLNSRVRAVIAAGLEMLRRFQWNFYRLENEQIGNTDQYRATREVPLPYSSTYRPEDDDDEDSDLEENAAAAPDKPASTYKTRSSLRMSKMLRPRRSSQNGAGDMGILRSSSRASGP